MLDEALELLALGLSVIPLVKETKLPPEGATWKNQQDILPAEDLIIKRFTDNPGCNLGVITGVGSGIVVIDGDSKEACEWIEINFPKTWLTVSNQGRGKHYYYGWPPNAKIKTSNKLIHPNVDVRGQGGLVVAPPSIHYSGNVYTWNIAPGFSLEDIQNLPLCPMSMPGIISQNIAPADHVNIKYCNGELINIARQCAWLRHCKDDARTLCYDELLWMTNIVTKCKDGQEKAHILLKMALGSNYNPNKSQKMINGIINDMGAISCRTISSKFEKCFECQNLGKGINFSPIILSNESPISTDIEIIEEKDIQSSDLSIVLDRKIIDPGGLISEGMEALSTPELPSIPQYSYPIVIALIARALAGKVTYSRVWPNFYFVKIGGTNTGKTDGDNYIAQSMEGYDFPGFFGSDDFSSGPGLLKGLEKYPQCIINMDEITYLFKRFDKPDPLTSGKIDILLQLFTRCGRSYTKTYSDAKKIIRIDKPYLTIVGNATSGIFDNIRQEDFTSGLIQRFTFWYYGGDIPERKPYTQEYSKKMASFLKILSNIYNYEIISNDLTTIVNSTTELVLEKESYNRLCEYSAHLREVGNKEDDEGKTGIICRKYYESIKYALVHWASRNFDISYPLRVDDIDYGIMLADLCGDWKLDVLYKKVKTGDFHRICDIFKEGIASVTKKGRPTTGKNIVNRRTCLKNLKPHDFDNVVKALAARKEIIVDDSGTSTKYFLVKEIICQ